MSMMRYNERVCPQQRSEGFSLFELLIALLVLAIGLLGYATLQSQGIKSNTSASFRSEATFLAMDISERMRANPTGNYIMNTATNDYSAPACTELTCAAGAARASWDQSAWEAAISQRLPGGQGIVAASGGFFMVTLMWDDERTGITGTGCGGDANTDLLCMQTLVMP